MKKRISALLLAMLCLMMNVCLSMSNEAKADLDKELAQMIGETGTKVPGLGVIAFKDGKFYEDGAHFAPQGKAPENSATTTFGRKQSATPFATMYLSADIYAPVHQQRTHIHECILCFFNVFYKSNVSPLPFRMIPSVLDSPFCPYRKKSNVVHAKKTPT